MNSVGSPKENPTYQLETTTYMRIYAQAATPEPLSALKLLLADETMQHFSGTLESFSPTLKRVRSL